MKDKDRYTQDEINSKINILTHQLDDLKVIRRNNNTVIREKRKQIEYWENFNINQLKIA